MIFKEEKKNLFTVDFKKYTPAHCIASDCIMGAGIAIPMKKKFRLSSMIRTYNTSELKHPTCILYNNVFNLITKKVSFGKPTYASLQLALHEMANYAWKYNINNIVMPKIGCGLDGLSWGKVRQIIEKEFADTDIEILVCHL